jgi:hypothetical protein
MEISKAVETTETIEQETENLLKVTQKFIELKSINKLPVIKANDTGGRVTVNKIKEDMRRKPWFSENMSTDLEGCSDLYMAEVESKRDKLKYFFCIENSTIKLISTYMQHDEKWIKIEE